MTNRHSAPMVVALYTDSAVVGGAERAMLDLAIGLDRDRWTPMLLFHDAPGIEALREAALLNGIPHFMAGRLGTATSFIRTLELARLLRSQQPDLIHVQLSWPGGCTEALVASLLARVPASIATLHLFNKPDGLLAAARQSISRTVVNRYIVVSNELGRRLQHVFGVSWQMIEVIRNGTRITGTDAVTQRVSASLLVPGVREGSHVVLVVGRLETQKGHRYLLEAALAHPQVTFLFAGDGSQRETLAELIATNGLANRVFLLGHRDDIPSLLGASDLFVLPSLNEGLPLAILEAMNACVPVIATELSGISELIEHGRTGWLVPPADGSALASAIGAALSDAPLRKTVAEQARQRVEQQFPLEKSIAATAALYDRVIQESRRRTRRRPRGSGRTAPLAGVQ